MKSSGRGPTSKRGEKKGDILAAARAMFTTRPYADVTVREIAAKADVDPAMINYYFGSKAALFRQSLSLPRDPQALIDLVFSPGIHDAGRRMAKVVISLWAQVELTDRVHVITASLLSTDAALTMFRGWIGRNLVNPAAAYLDGPDAKLRVTLAGSHIIGIIGMRFITKIEPIASMSEDDLVNIVGPVLQRYLDGTYKLPPMPPPLPPPH
ncbi:MAG: TetR family transcriptional regulator [Actinomycetaceae bacterium]|nr:TetR family transcriptional regulator [Actinomycetaceae bacterium]